MTYQPDNWVVIKFPNHYRLLSGWSGGYTTGGSWRLNSGIVSVEEEPYHFIFSGNSDSVYKCHKESYCLRKNNAHVFGQLQQLHGDKVAIMPKDTDWLSVDWLISKTR